MSELDQITEKTGELKALLEKFETRGTTETVVPRKPAENPKGNSSPILRFFVVNESLPEIFQSVSRPLCEMAKNYDAVLPNGPEKSAGLRKLLEAKDCFIRSLVK